MSIDSILMNEKVFKVTPLIVSSHISHLSETAVVILF